MDAGSVADHIQVGIGYVVTVFCGVVNTFGAIIY